MKIARNDCYGGFGLSDACVLKMAELGGYPIRAYNQETHKEGERVIYDRELEISENPKEAAIKNALKRLSGCRYYECFINRDNRDDPILIAAIEAVGENAAGGRSSKIKIVEIPDDVQWEIDDYDGWESVKEKHRSW